MLAQLNNLLPPNRQGIAVDLLAIVANLLFFPIFAERIDRLFDAAFGNDVSAFGTLAVLMLIILLARLAGLYFKRYPLRARSHGSGGKSGANYALALVIFSVPVFILTLAFVMTLIQALVTGTTTGGGPADQPLVDPSVMTYIGVPLMLAMLVFEVYLIYRLTSRLSPREKRWRANGNWRFRPLTEYAADLGLFAYMLIWQVFYYQVAETLLTMPDGRPVPVDMLGISIIFLAISFLIFYVSPRAVFLIEDRKYASAWVSILLVFISSIVRHL